MTIEYDPDKDAVNLAKHGLSLADAWRVYGAPNKVTLRSSRVNEARQMDVALVETMGVVLALVYVERDGWCGRFLCAVPRVRKGGCMKTQAKTDLVRVKCEAAADVPIAQDAETDLYDPNDEAATAAFWATAKVTRRGRPAAAVKRPTLNMRVDADVLEHLRGLGKGWQTKVNQLLREAVGQGKL